jgi:lipopolysaccharide export LptBFGC system permease protein LptF
MEHPIALLLWARFVLLVACGALVALYLWIGYRSHRAGRAT